jgi:hypothetical protein
MKENKDFDSINIDVEEIIIGKDVTDVPPVLSFLNKFKRIVVEEGNKYFKSINGVLYSVDGVYLLKYPQCKEGKKFIIPKEVKYISDYAFSDCKFLTDIEIHKNMLSFGIDVFKFTPLSNVIIEDINAFARCAFGTSIFNKKTQLYVDSPPAGVIHLNSRIELHTSYVSPNAFENLQLKVVILNNVNSIGDDAFKNCNIEDCNVYADSTDLKKHCFFGNPKMKLIINSSKVRLISPFDSLERLYLMEKSLTVGEINFSCDIFCRMNKFLNKPEEFILPEVNREVLIDIYGR